MKAALSQVCSLSSSFQADVQDYAAGQCRAIEVWLTKLETYLETHSHAQLTELTATCGVALPVASFQGGLLTSQGAKRTAAWQLLDQRLRLCRQVGISTLVVAADLHPPLESDDLPRMRESLRRLAEEAARSEMRVALEFQARASFCNNLQTTVAVVDDVGSPHLGVCLDAFHFHVGPSKTEDLNCLTRENLFHVQLCDLVDVPRELADDQDRILPGEGEIALNAIIDYLRRIGYEDYVSLELMNPQIWRVPALQFGEIGMTSLRCVLGQAKGEV